MPTVGILDAGPYRHASARTAAPGCSWISLIEHRVNEGVFDAACPLVSGCALFVSVGTSGVVGPAAGFAQLARDSGALMVEVNPEDNETSALYAHRLRGAASTMIPRCFSLPVDGGSGSSPLGIGVPGSTLRFAPLALESLSCSQEGTRDWRKDKPIVGRDQK